MDERLQKALEFSNYTLTLNNQKNTIKSRVAQLQTVHFNGGVFKANPTTISFVQTLIMNEMTSAVIADEKENPVKIYSLSEFLNKLLEAYSISMNEFDVEYGKIKKARNIKTLMDW